MEKYYIIYKTTNIVNDKIYIGIHYTSKLNDSYIGSGKLLKQEIKIIGREKFKKEILFIFYDKQTALLKEEELVTKEFCKREDTYNQIKGGGGYLTTDMVVVKDKENLISLVYKTDPRYISGELIHINKGKTNVINKDGKIIKVDVKDKNKYSPVWKGYVIVRDKNNNRFKVKKDNPKFLSGELIPYARGLKRNETEETKNKRKKSLSISQKGKNNGMYKKFWINNGFENKIWADYNTIPENWIKGRLLKIRDKGVFIYIWDGIKRKEHKINEPIPEGYVRFSYSLLKN